jgi:predicted exporter
MALYPQGLRSIVRNSLLLAVAAPLPTFAMLGLSAMLFMPVLWIGWGIFLVTPIVVALFWAANCDLQVARRQVKP